MVFHQLLLLLQAVQVVEVVVQLVDLELQEIHLQLVPLKEIQEEIRHLFMKLVVAVEQLLLVAMEQHLTLELVQVELVQQVVLQDHLCKELVVAVEVLIIVLKEQLLVVEVLEQLLQVHQIQEQRTLVVEVVETTLDHQVLVVMVEVV